MTQISHVTPKDIPDLQAMIQKLCAFHGDPCHLGLEEAQRRFVDGPLTALIARQDDRAVGYAVIESHWRPMDTQDGLDIAHLFVEAPFRGQGIGRSLVGAAKEYACKKRASRLTIGAALGNRGAAAAYRAMGLEEMTGKPGPRFWIALQ